MAGERQLPGLGLYGFWTLGSNGYREQHSGNLRLLSALAQLSVVSRTTALPASPTLGDIYIVPGGAGSNPNEIAIRDYAADDVTEAWVYVTPPVGTVAHVQDDDEYMRWNGTAWAYLGTVKAPSELVLTDGDSLTEAHFAQNILCVASPAVSTVTEVTIPAGLSPFSSAHFVNTGAGDVVFIQGAGATLQSKFSNKKLEGEYAFCSIIPRGPDTYMLIGDLSA